MTTEVENPVTCDECGSTRWQGGPQGGLGQMFQCENGHWWTFYFGILEMWDKVWMKHRSESTIKGDLKEVEEGSWP